MDSLICKINRLKYVLLIFAFLVSIITPIVIAEDASATPTITITSPTANQQIAGTNFTVTGTATPNTTVVVSNNGLSLVQTKSDGSGNWSANVSTLQAGNISLTAKAIENPTYGYFMSTPDLVDVSINRIRLSDNSINPGGSGWPIASTALPLVFGASPTQEVLFGINPIDPASQPSKFVPSSGLAPVITTNYPANSAASIGAFSADGLKYYVPNQALGTVSIIDVASNTQTGDIVTGGEPKTAWLGTNNKIYIINSNNLSQIINTTTDTVESDFQTPCTAPNSSMQASFSQDINYPYYFITCKDDGTILKLKIADNSLVASFNVGLQPLTALLSLDNKRLFFSSFVTTPDAEKVRVIDTDSGATLNTIDLTAGALGIFPTSDFQKIYVSTPGNFDTTNIDVIDTTTYAVTAVPVSGIPGSVTTLPSQVAETDVSVSFVLGATTPATATSNLAETGILTISSVLLLGLIIASSLYLYTDYRKHKKPLMESNPNVHYTFAHHIRVVSIPLLRYRLTFSVSKNNDIYRRF